MLGYCEFLAAVLHGDLKYLHQILTEYPDIDVNVPIIGKSSALHIAASKRYSSIVKVLIARGADVNALDEKGETPLQHAFDSPLSVYHLLKENADVNIVTNSHSFTPLHMATHIDSVGLIQMILARGADPTLRDCRGDTPLSVAIRGYPDIAIELLLGTTYMDPNITAGSVKCNTPLLLCLQRCMFSVARALVLAGYRGPLELEQYHLGPCPDPQNHVHKELSAQDKAARKFFEKSCEIMPLSLQDLTRLAIRRDLKTDIRNKIDRFPYPQFIKDYLLFEDIYQPLDISTEEKANAYMVKHEDIVHRFGDIIIFMAD